MIKKGDLVKYRKQECFTYKIYRVKEVSEKMLVLIPALNYINNGTIKIPRTLSSNSQIFNILSEDEKHLFILNEFKHACYQSCVEVDRLIDKLDLLDKQTDSHRVKGEISSFLITLNKRFDRIKGEDNENIIK